MGLKLPIVKLSGCLYQPLIPLAISISLQLRQPTWHLVACQPASHLKKNDAWSGKPRGLPQSWGGRERPQAPTSVLLPGPPSTPTAGEELPGQGANRRRAHLPGYPPRPATNRPRPPSRPPQGTRPRPPLTNPSRRRPLSPSWPSSGSGPGPQGAPQPGPARPQPHLARLREAEERVLPQENPLLLGHLSHCRATGEPRPRHREAPPERSSPPLPVPATPGSSRHHREGRLERDPPACSRRGCLGRRRVGERWRCCHGDGEAAAAPGSGEC